MNTQHDVHNVFSGTMLTSSGIKVDLRNPDPALINIHDIARGLANTCRFGGQINGFYSVAQHTMLVKLLAPPMFKKLATFHDTAEAYVHDIIKPLKNIIGGNYETIESAWMEVIFKKFGLDIKDLPQIKPFDKAALQLEHDFFHYKDEAFSDMFLTNYRHFPILWDSSMAYAIMYKELSNIQLNIN